MTSIGAFIMSSNHCLSLFYTVSLNCRRSSKEQECARSGHSDICLVFSYETPQLHVNTRLGTDHHQLIMPPISKDCSKTFLKYSFIYSAPCEWNQLSEHIRTLKIDSHFCKSWQLSTLYSLFPNYNNNNIYLKSNIQCI